MILIETTADEHTNVKKQDNGKIRRKKEGTKSPLDTNSAYKLTMKLILLLLLNQK